MPTKRRFEIPELFPQPKFVEMGEGISEMSADVRLATTNVSPVQRKALRSILNIAGVRVVANKKKYVVNAQVCPPEENPDEFNLSDVPEYARKDYYELRIQGSEVFIKTPYQSGMVWAAQTLATLFSMMIDGRAVPNLFLRDWPVMPTRGILMDCNWSVERMSLTDWQFTIDALSAVKLNTLGIGVYNCLPECCLSGPKQPDEFMLTPISEEDNSNDPCSELRYRYYNAKYDRWYDKTLIPEMFDEDFFSEIVNYGRERGIEVFPYFNFLSHSTLLQRHYPELSAVNDKGKPSGTGFCFSKNAAMKTLTSFLGMFLDKYFPEGIEYFHIGVDGLNEDTWCCCDKCQSAAHDKLFAEFLKKLTQFLVSKGVQKVVLFSDELLAGEKFFSGALSTLLKKNSELASHLIIDWEDLGNEDSTQLIRPETAAKLGLANWVGPLGCDGNYSNYTDHRKNLDAGLTIALKQKTDGLVARSQYDPAFIDHYALIGARCWEEPNWKEDTTDSIQERWAALQWGGYSDELLEARREINAAANTPEYLACLPFQAVKVIKGAKKGKRTLTPYPEVALEALAKMKDATASLNKSIAGAQKAYEVFEKMLNDRRANWTEPQLIVLRGLLASAMRIIINAEQIVLLTTIKADAGKSSADKKLPPIIDQALEKLVGQLHIMEENLPDWLLYINMQMLSCHKLFLEQLKREIKAKKTADKISWTLPENWECPEDI